MNNLLQGLGSRASDLFRTVIIKAISLGDTLDQILTSVGGILKLSLDRSLTNARTEFYNSFREGFTEQLQENTGEDNVTEWIWRAERDVKTCIVCITMDGTKHPLDEAMKSHVNCRCQMEVVSNEVSIKDDGRKWFDDRSEEEQKEVLGKGKYEALKDRKITIDDLIGIDNNGYYYEKPLKYILERKDTA